MEPTAPDTPRRDTDQRRIEIAAAARALIAERGFEGLRTRDIAERVGINVATLHYHVPSKDALVELLAGSLRDEFMAQHRERPRDGQSAIEQLHLECTDFRDTLLNRPETHRVMAELSERARRDPKVAAVMGPMQAYWHAKVAAILAKGRDDGSFRADLDPQAAAIIIIGSLIGTLRQPENRLEQFDRVAAELQRSFANSHKSRQDIHRD